MIATATSQSLQQPGFSPNIRCYNRGLGASDPVLYRCPAQLVAAHGAAGGALRKTGGGGRGHRQRRNALRGDRDWDGSGGGEPSQIRQEMDGRGRVVGVSEAGGDVLTRQLGNMGM